MGRGAGCEIVGRVFGTRRGQEPQQCGRCHAERDPRDLFCGRCGEDFTGTGAAHVLEPDPPGSPSRPLEVLDFDPPGSDTEALDAVEATQTSPDGVQA